MKFKRPARLGDLVDVITAFRLESPFRGRFSQRLECRGELLVEVDVSVVCIDARQQRVEFPSLWPWIPTMRRPTCSRNVRPEDCNLCEKGSR